MELEVGGVITKRVSVSGVFKFAKVPTVGITPWTVSVIEIFAEAKLPMWACEAVMIEVPIPTGVNVVPLIVAIFGLDDEKVQAPGEVEVGLVKVKLATLSF